MAAIYFIVGMIVNLLIVCAIMRSWDAEGSRVVVAVSYFMTALLAVFLGYNWLLLIMCQI